jgi:uncharacterized protein (TIGR02145 family)
MKCPNGDQVKWAMAICTDKDYNSNAYDPERQFCENGVIKQKPKALDDDMVRFTESVENFVFARTYYKPSYTVTDGSYELILNTDYTESWSNNWGASTATNPAKLTITGKGIYNSVVVKEFTIGKTAGPDLNGAPVAIGKTAGSITAGGVSATSNPADQGLQYAILSKSEWDENEELPEVWQSENLLKGLKPGTEYYVFARSAENNNAYAGKAEMSEVITTLEQVSYSCGEDDMSEEVHNGILKSKFCDERDGQAYFYVEIGGAIWMAQNLNYGGPDGDIGVCYGTNQTDKETNCKNYGRLYNLNKAKEVCPVGWHLPSQDELEALLNLFVTSKATSGSGTEWRGPGKVLKANRTDLNNYQGTDIYGFSALLGGWSLNSSSYSNLKVYGYWWAETAYYMMVNTDNVTVYSGSTITDYYAGAYHYGVRCVKDTENAEAIQ